MSSKRLEFGEVFAELSCTKVHVATLNLQSICSWRIRHWIYVNFSPIDFIWLHSLEIIGNLYESAGFDV